MYIYIHFFYIRYAFIYSVRIRGEAHFHFIFQHLHRRLAHDWLGFALCTQSGLFFEKFHEIPINLKQTDANKSDQNQKRRPTSIKPPGCRLPSAMECVQTYPRERHQCIEVWNGCSQLHFGSGNSEFGTWTSAWQPRSKRIDAACRASQIIMSCILL